MIPRPEQLAEISRQGEGSLTEVPFSALLLAMAVHQRTAVLEVRRKMLSKQITIELGVPIDCRSNLAHETLGRYMVAQGRLQEENLLPWLSVAASRHMPLGEVLLEQKVVSAEELFKILQQNLAKKLLDVFAWRDGEFRLLPEMPKPESSLKIRVPQLIVTGITKCSPQEEVDAGVAPLVGKKLALHPAPPFSLDEIRLSPRHAQAALALRAGWRIDELAMGTGLPFEEITRLLYALAILGVVVTADQVPKGKVPAPAAETGARPRATSTTRLVVGQPVPGSPPAAAPPSRAAGSQESSPAASLQLVPPASPASAVSPPVAGAGGQTGPGAAPPIGSGAPSAIDPGAPSAIGPGAPPAIGPGAAPPIGPGVPPAIGPGAPPAIGPGAPPAIDPGAPPAIDPSAPPAIDPSAPPALGPGAAGPRVAPAASPLGLSPEASAARPGAPELPPATAPAASSRPDAPASAASGRRVSTISVPLPGAAISTPPGAARAEAAASAGGPRGAAFPTPAPAQAAPTMEVPIQAPLPAPGPPAGQSADGRLATATEPEVPAPAMPIPAERRNEVMQAFLSYRRQDAFDLLGAPEDASFATIESCYLDFAVRYAPWTLGSDPGGIQEKARDLFLAGARAYAELMDLEQRNTLLFRRKTLREERAKKAGGFTIKTDLLDSEAQYRKGKALMDAAKYKEAFQLLEFASDCDPQNGLYSAELAYCRFLHSPSSSALALKELEETVRRDPDCGIALFYSGEIHRQLGDAAAAEPLLRRAIKAMSPDRRPIDALKALAAAGKKR